MASLRCDLEYAAKRFESVAYESRKGFRLRL